jgi:4-amino-4-deoxy-L-arabinose transferase-like glycosyltransferase
MPLNPLARLLASLDRSPRRWLLGILALALLARLAIVFLFPETIISLGNREKNDLYARLFVSSGVFGEPVGPLAGQPNSATRPAYAWFLIAIYTTIGRGTYTIGVAQAVLSAVNVLLVFVLATRLVGRRPALGAALAMALYPYPVWHDVHVVRTALDTFFSLATLLFLVELGRTQKLRFAFAAGACAVGAAQATNMLVPFLPIAALWLVVAWRNLPRAIAAGAVLGFAAVLALAPWVARNQVLHGRFIPFSTDNGIAFLKNNNPYILDIVKSNLGPDNAAKYVFDPEEFKLPEAEQDALFWSRGIQWIADNPGDKLELMAYNVLNYWDPTTIRPLTNTFFEGNQQVLETKVWLYRLSFGPILVLGLIGIARRLPADRNTWLILALFAYNTLLYSATYASTRYRIPFDGVLAAYAAETVLAAATVLIRRHAPSSSWRRDRGVVTGAPA